VFFPILIREENRDNFSVTEYFIAHTRALTGEAKVLDSASGHTVPLLRSVEENIGPKEAFVPAISSCHMLFVLPITAERVYQVEN
jgi:hypothetical protein